MVRSTPDLSRPGFTRCSRTLTSCGDRRNTEAVAARRTRTYARRRYSYAEDPRSAGHAKCHGSEGDLRSPAGIGAVTNDRRTRRRSAARDTAVFAPLLSSVEAPNCGSPRARDCPRAGGGPGREHRERNPSNCRRETSVESASRKLVLRDWRIAGALRRWGGAFLPVHRLTRRWMVSYSPERRLVLPSHRLSISRRLGHIAFNGWSSMTLIGQIPLGRGRSSQIFGDQVGARRVRGAWGNRSLVRLLRGSPGPRSVVGGRRCALGGGIPGLRVEHVHLHDRRAGVRRRDGVPHARRRRPCSARSPAVGASRRRIGRRRVSGFPSVSSPWLPYGGPAVRGE